MPTLADIYSAADSFKRRLSDVVQNPGLSLQQMIGYANDRARAFNELSAQAAQESMDTGQLFGPKSRQVGEILAEAYNPVGMTVKYGYRGQHTAPGPDFGAPLHDLTGGGQMYPSDVYSASASRIYGTGYPKADREAFDLAKRVRGNPNAEVTMYRAVPKDEKITSINTGDWVTLSKEYAKTHGESVLGENYKILSKKVKAKELYTNADSIHEFGYHPEQQ
jgi:hypothetical protein